MTSDPSMTDTKTLLKSLERDLDMAWRNNQERDDCMRWMAQARVTVHELNERAERGKL